MCIGISIAMGAQMTKHEFLVFRLYEYCVRDCDEVGDLFVGPF